MIRALVMSPRTQRVLAERAAEVVARVRQAEPRLNGSTRRLLSDSYLWRLLRERDAAATQAERDDAEVAIERLLEQRREEFFGPDRVRRESPAARRVRLRRFLGAR